MEKRRKIQKKPKQPKQASSGIGGKVVLNIALLAFRIALLVLVIWGVYRVGATSYKLSYSIMANTAMEEPPGRDISVTLDGNMGVKDVAKLLERKGLIEDADVFRMQLKINKYESKLHLGTYEMNTSMTSKEIMQMMAGEYEEPEEEDE